MVLLATPGMLHGGLSMQVFKEWCTSNKNSLIIPGYCVAGTLGNKLISGIRNVRVRIYINKTFRLITKIMMFKCK